MKKEYSNISEYFKKGKESFEEGLENVDLSIFKNYKEAYSRLIMDLTVLCAEAIQLVISKNDETETLFVSDGFARNEIFVKLIKSHFPDKKIQISEIDN